MKSGKIDQYIGLSQFKNLKDFNNHFEQQMVDYKASFTKSELIALKRLVRFSAKVPGICNAKIQTIVAACNELGEISRRTFERMLKKAKELGILQVINTQKGNGKQGHNVYVFSKYEQGLRPHVTDNSIVVSEISISPVNDVPKQVEIVAPKESINLLETSKIKDNKRTDSLPVEFVSDNVPKDFSNLAGCYFNKASVIEKLWSKVNIASYKYCFEQDKQLTLEVGIASLRQTVRAIKVKKIRSQFGYFYGVLIKKFQEEYFEGLAEIEKSMS